MTNDLVTVGNFLFVPEAEAARLHLQEEGIQAFLSNAELVNMDWFLGNATGYVKILVPNDQATAARGILETLRAQKQARQRNSSNAATKSICLACGEHLPPKQSTCAACGWSYAVERRDANSGREVQTTAQQAAPRAANEAPAQESDEDAAESAETNATNLRLLIGLFLGGLIALWLLPVLRSLVRNWL